jgi:YVTN family beta-propeller protein
MTKLFERLAVGILLGSLLISCTKEKTITPAVDESEGIGQGPDNCTVDDWSLEDATAPTGRLGENQWIAANGKIISPAGDFMELAGAQTIALTVVITPDEQRVVVGNNDGSAQLELLRFDDDNDLIDHLEIESDIAGDPYNGMIFNQIGDLLFISVGGSDRLDVYRVDDLGMQVIGTVKIYGYISGLALSPDETMLYTAGSQDNTFSAIDVSDPENPQVLWNTLVGFFPYSVAASPTRNEVYVSNFQSTTIAVVDLVLKRTVAMIEVGKNPEGIVVTPDGKKLFVAASDSDIISVVDVETRSVVTQIDVTHNEAGLVGSWPTALAYDGDRALLYAALSGRSQIDVIDATDYTILGSIPTGWKPTGVALSPDGEKIYVTSLKGLGGKPSQPGDRGSKKHPGTLQIIDRPTESELDGYTITCDENYRRTLDVYNTSCRNVVPLPSTEEQLSPIKHVVWIVKENKTYDEVLGDLAGEQGDFWHDPALTLFGEDITPNIHRLARQYTNLVNYYIPIEESDKGHTTFVAGICNDFCEKNEKNQGIFPGFDPGGMPAGGTVFDNCFNNGVSFRNYGEIVGFGAYLFGTYAENLAVRFPFYNNNALDVYKAAVFVRELKAGIFPEFVFIALPNDHTNGQRCGSWTPPYMVADNDAGMGMIVEAITHSPYWEETLILIFQDDPQSASGDHIDARRSLMVAVSPWVKRGYVSKVHYSAESVHKTTEMILGLPPLGSFDADATPFYDIFTSEPDFTTYEASPNPVPIEFNCEDDTVARNSRIEEIQAGFDLETVDKAPGMGDVIWHYMKGDTPRPGYAKRIDR